MTRPTSRPARSRASSTPNGSSGGESAGSRDQARWPASRWQPLQRRSDTTPGHTNTYAAYEALSDNDKAEIAELRVLYTFAAAQRLVQPDASERERAAWDKVPAQEHPLVWTRRDRRKSLLIGSTADYVIGWPADKSRALLDRLLEFAPQPRFVLRHHWHVGDLVMWDNTGLLHRAIPYAATSPRLMHRTTLVGEVVVA